MAADQPPWHGEPPRRHLLRTTGRQRRSACGVNNPRLYTHDPAYVDCLACQRTVFMAEAELRKQQKRRNR